MEKKMENEMEAGIIWGLYCSNNTVARITVVMVNNERNNNGHRDLSLLNMSGPALRTGWQT